jgi:hypothetical protein
MAFDFVGKTGLPGVMLGGTLISKAFLVSLVGFFLLPCSHEQARLALNKKALHFVQGF